MLDCPARRNTFVGQQTLQAGPGSTPIHNKVVAILIAAGTKPNISNYLTVLMDLCPLQALAMRYLNTLRWGYILSSWLPQHDTSACPQKIHVSTRIGCQTDGTSTIGGTFWKCQNARICSASSGWSCTAAVNMLHVLYFTWSSLTWFSLTARKICCER